MEMVGGRDAQVGEYAKKAGDVVLAVEPVGRFESHFLNIAEDAVGIVKKSAPATSKYTWMPST